MGRFDAMRNARGANDGFYAQYRDYDGGRVLVVVIVATERSGTSHAARHGGYR